MAARIALIAASLLLALSASADARAASTPGPDDTGCTAAAPEPTLRDDAYPSQRFQRRAGNRAVESARLGDGITLDIGYAGCADVVRRTIVLRVERTVRDHGAWAAYAHDTLRDLHAHPARRWFDPGLLRFLSDLAKAPAGKIERCFDGTTPGADGCPSRSGGGYLFEIREEPTLTVVTVGQYDLL